jgi:hypothetical protein
MIVACDLPASVTGMIPTSFETVRKHPQSVRVSVTGGQETEAVGRPHVRNSAFAQALVQSIERSQTFAKVIEGQSTGGDYLLTATLFSMDKRVFGRTVKLEVGWTLRRIDTGVVAWQESIVSEYTEGNVQVATEGAARNNIAQALGKISRLNL